MISKEFWKGKRVLITGHTGFKGSWLCIWLNMLGANVTGYALDPPTKPSLFNLSGIGSFIDDNRADIRDSKALNSLFNNSQPEIVIHMAAQPLVRESYLDPVTTYETNVMGTVNLLEAVRNSDSTRAVVNVTTDKCYENKEWIWGYRENEAMGGYDPYSNSKACSELVTSSYRNSYFCPKEYGTKHKVALATARAGNVIGGGDFAKDRLVPDIIRSLQEQEPVLIRSPYSIRPWQHVLEPLSGYLLLCEKLYEDGIECAEAWNFGPEDSDAQTVEWIVKEMCALWGEGAKYEIDKHPQPHEAKYLKLDISKAKQLLGWNPKWNLSDTLKSIISSVSEKNHLNSCQDTINEYMETKVK